MLAGPGSTAELLRFAALARHLAGLGLSPPGIFASDPEAGLMLIEDLGDDLFVRRIAGNPAEEMPLYEAAAGVLATLARHPPPAGLPVLDAAIMPPLVAPLFEWYAPGTGAGERRAIEAALGEALAAVVDAAPSALVHRDFHAENLIWLPERSAQARVGLLDFQDAHAGPSAYDMVSLVEDARRDVSEAARNAAIAAFLDLTGGSGAALAGALAALGAQRNLRILGIFARLARRDGRPGYLRFVPRVWAHLRRDLSHPSLAALARHMAVVPPPSAAFLESLRTPCP